MVNFLFFFLRRSLFWRWVFLVSDRIVISTVKVEHTSKHSIECLDGRGLPMYCGHGPDSVTVELSIFIDFRLQCLSFKFQTLRSSWSWKEAKSSRIKSSYRRYCQPYERWSVRAVQKLNQIMGLDHLVKWWCPKSDTLPALLVLLFEPSFYSLDKASMLDMANQQGNASLHRLNSSG